MADATMFTVADRAELLREGLASRGGIAGTALVSFLETAGTLDDADFRTSAASVGHRLRPTSDGARAAESDVRN
jgi:hypothetical protein